MSCFVGSTFIFSVQLTLPRCSSNLANTIVFLPSMMKIGSQVSRDTAKKWWARVMIWSDLHKRSYAASWYSAIDSMSSRPARWWWVRSSARQLEWMTCTRASAAKNLSSNSSPVSDAISSLLSWYCWRKVSINCDFPSDALRSSVKPAVRSRRAAVEDVLLLRVVLMLLQHLDSAFKLDCTLSSIYSTDVKFHSSVQWELIL